MKLALLYRGPLSSCNYGCTYCPFAKHKESRAELTRDRRALDRFVDWVAGRASDTLSVFFTPWGEALIRPSYQRALARLTRLAQVERAAVQTNLSARLDWLATCEPSRLGIWATYHPGWTSRPRFVEKCVRLRDAGAHVSAGVVGLREHFDEIELLRRDLPGDVYVWVNAIKREAAYYSEDELRRLERVDPLFGYNTRNHRSVGRACRTGASVVSVDGDGTLRRCHFVRDPIGNLYELGFERALGPRPCPNETCGCHIGYVHLEYLELDKVFGAGVLERVPEAPVAPGRRLPLAYA